MIVGRDVLRVAASVRVVARLVRAAVRAHHAADRVNLTVHAERPRDIEAYLATQQALAGAVSEHELAQPTAAMRMVAEEET